MCQHQHNHQICRSWNLKGNHQLETQLSNIHGTYRIPYFLKYSLVQAGTINFRASDDADTIRGRVLHVYFRGGTVSYNVL